MYISSDTNIWFDFYEIHHLDHPFRLKYEFYISKNAFMDELRRRFDMGSRGAFVDVNAGDFTFVDGGQHYMSLGSLAGNANVKVIVQDSNNVKAPEFSHTAGRVYAIVKDGALKHLAYYDDNHKQAVSIDFSHDHKGVRPHRHEYMSHNKNDPGIPPTAAEKEMIRKIKKEFHLK